MGDFSQEIWVSKTKFERYHYDLAKLDNIKVFEEIKENLVKIALPLMDEYSDYERAADLLLKRRQFFCLSQIIDFYIIENKTEEAKNAITFIESCFNQEKNTPPELISELNERKNVRDDTA